MSVVLEEGRGQRKDQLKTPLTPSERGRFPPPLAAPVVLERQSSRVRGECHIPGTVSGSGESVMKKCSFSLFLQNRQLQDLWLQRAVVCFTVKSAAGQGSAGLALCCSLGCAPRKLVIPFQGRCRLRAQLGLRASGFISFLVALCTSFFEAPLPQASS